MQERDVWLLGSECVGEKDVREGMLTKGIDLVFQVEKIFTGEFVRGGW